MLVEHHNIINNGNADVAKIGVQCEFGWGARRYDKCGSGLAQPNGSMVGWEHEDGLVAARFVATGRNEAGAEARMGG